MEGRGIWQISWEKNRVETKASFICAEETAAKKK